MHLFALIPGQGASQLLRQLTDVLGKRSNNSRRVLAGDLDEHREAGIALDEGSDVRVVCSGKKVSFPMPRHSAILNLGGPLADRDHIEDMPLSTLRVVALGVTHPPRSTPAAVAWTSVKTIDNHPMTVREKFKIDDTGICLSESYKRGLIKY